MRVAMIVAIVLLVGAIINWARNGATFPLPQVLPGCGGGRPPLFEVGAVVLCLLGWWGISRLTRRSDDE